MKHLKHFKNEIFKNEPILKNEKMKKEGNQILHRNGAPLLRGPEGAGWRGQDAGSPADEEPSPPVGGERVG